MIDLRTQGTVTSGFGQRTSPTAGASSNHKGLDIVLSDKNIPSVEAGEVTYKGYSNSGGNMVFITGANGVTTKYMHLASESPLSVGDVVREGQTIGIMGSTGISTGDHLHIEFNRGGTVLDPDEYFSSGGSGLVTTTSNNGGSGWAMGLVGNIIEFVVILLVLVLAVVLFMKAFDIQLR